MATATFLKTPQQRISAIVLIVALAVVAIDYVIYIIPFSYNASKYTTYYLRCIANTDVRSVCESRQGYLHLAISSAILALLGLYWSQTYGRVIAAVRRAWLWIKTGA